MQPALFLSDLHLSPERPGVAAAFHRFCAGPAREAAAVYVLGDLFDWWLGDDQLREPFASRVADSLLGVSRSGVALFVARGNRDFLLGERFAAAAGITFLPEQQRLDVGDVATLISHGDELCTGDIEYQRLRARMRSPATQRRLLALPYFVRRLIALGLRRKSRDATANKPEAILDVDERAVAETFRRFAVTRLIHGHTHRPSTHHLTVDGVRRERIVLADWHDRGHFLAIDKQGQASSHEIAAA
jgi:UDP-2,3-diacylglucosamine hydrolase